MANHLYSAYKEIIQKAADIQYASAVLEWDQEVYMPPKGYTFRGKQLATLASVAHQLLTNDEYASLLKEVHLSNELNGSQKDNVRLSIEDYDKSSKLSANFIEKLSRQTSLSYNAWIKARKENNYEIYAPELNKMIELKREQAKLYGYKDHPYDTLLDDYEKGATVKMLDPVFKMVREELYPLLNKIKNAPQVPNDFFHQNFPKQKQWDFSIEVLKRMGYDMEAGRQDYSEHPFTTSFAATDVRITTRVDDNNFASLLWSTIHEGGHALYEQGLPADEYGLPLGAAASLSIHESQSRLWENCIGRGIHFWKYFYPLLQQYFPEQLQHISLQDFYKGMNRVAPSLIRTEADELTYHFHVMIRYEIEKGLISGDMNTNDIAAIWNDMYEKYLGMKPQDDKSGVLQDVHWSHGSFGYFPTYSLGSFYAAQFLEQFEKDNIGFEQRLEQGDSDNLLKWLRENIHKYGRKYRSEELCAKVTGRALDFSSFMGYVNDKYSKVYELQ